MNSFKETFLTKLVEELSIKGKHDELKEDLYTLYEELLGDNVDDGLVRDTLAIVLFLALNSFKADRDDAKDLDDITIQDFYPIVDSLLEGYRKVIH